MKTKTILTILLTGMTLFLANCSKSNSNGSSNTAANSCGVGYAYVNNKGCLPTAQCTQMGYATNFGFDYTTNTCIAGTYGGSSTTTGTPTCNGQSGYVLVNGTCLPEAGCTQYRGQNGVAFYGYKINSYNQWACYPQNYQGQWYN
ncbi:hypothetical protein [Bdellovibrio sp. HCB274]|uniref:hypothetical protein n=1 Tax=Bdellovibrio sp. HCB274 TaxID=3394361 RepID=UPI0039B39FA8